MHCKDKLDATEANIEDHTGIIDLSTDLGLRRLMLIRKYMQGTHGMNSLATALNRPMRSIKPLKKSK